ncbi:ABC-2 type transporter-domain-containing protein [Xylariaceae sp. FL0016]|nr:ABC-2 type transporter-domain-containing protein [Xylariaceae sp. FL0016]
MSYMGNPYDNYYTPRSGVSPITPPNEDLRYDLQVAMAYASTHNDRPMTRNTSVTEAVDEYELNSAGPKDGKDDREEELERRVEYLESLVQELARKYTTSSQANGAPAVNPFLDAGGESDLNPHSPNFSARSWAKAFVNLAHSEGNVFRTSGICFQNMSVHGFGSATDYQKDVGNIWLETVAWARRMMGHGQTKIDILRDFDGIVHKGEMCIVLGPPGSGCTTFLKSISGDTNGIYIDDQTYFNYQGITAKEMHTQHRGEALYTAEQDVHFPELSVGDTLTFAAQAKQPRILPPGVDREAYANHLRDVTMAMFGISHTVNTQVGNDYIRGVSGGERKRVTISEAALSRAPLQCWDNSTRGLDSANAVEFCKTLRTQSEMFGTTCCVSIYQAPQQAYDFFDKAMVIYEGRQIFFGRADEAKEYFINLGFECPARQTTPDFLTSMTSATERVVRPGYEGKVPRTPDEFARAWKKSSEYRTLQLDIAEYKQEHPINGPEAVAFRNSRRQEQAKGTRSASPYTLSYGQQIGLCLWRGVRRFQSDPSLYIGSLVGNVAMALIVGSVFYNLQPNSTSFFQRAALLFFACLMNALSSALEMITLYAQRPIVEKHTRYALYHPSAEAISSMLCDIPYKVVNNLLFNITLYFITNLRREPGAFFTFIIFTFATNLAMSMIFRTIASASRTLFQALVPGAILILDLVIFTGFAIPIDYMLDWCRWLNYLDPLAYAFESLMVTEFHGRHFKCNVWVPSYPDATGTTRICNAYGTVAGEDFVDGDAYIGVGYKYFNSHKWRNLGVLFGFILFFMICHILASEYVTAAKSKGEVLLFRRGHKPAQFKDKKGDVEEGGRRNIGPVTSNGSGSKPKDGSGSKLEDVRSTFTWQDVCYDIKIKGEPRRILDHVDGWVKPGTLTALMGVSGAGKTTLLDTLASRITTGVITGDMLVDGRPRDMSFQRNTGYVQQQDLHLSTTTVREALNFSALLRQPAHIPNAEKLAYVDEVIELLEMEEYADAVVGVLGEGLNVEQRKRLTIGVELAAKPPLLLFVDEPTSGLDSQTSWAILDLLEKLTNAGQAILCTIHQPSAMLFQRFDRLLFLAKGGKTVYFGDIGENSRTMTSYFERHGAPPCPPEANPAEWMLDAIGAAPGTKTNVDWHQAWRDSAEHQAVKAELQRVKDNAAYLPPAPAEDPTKFREHAAPFSLQLREVTYRAFQQYWRSPAYIYSKAALCTLVCLFVGLVFLNAKNTIQGLQNQQFAVFNVLTVFGQLTQQAMPYFVIQRSLYEVRERPSKAYSWKVFMLSQIAVELPWNALMSVIMYVCWYYPIGLYRNTFLDGETAQRGALMFLLFFTFMMFAATFGSMVIAAFDTADAGANVANVLFTLCLVFCGVLANPDAIPRFWIFMYRVSPFTYLVSAMLSTALANTNVQCAANELLKFNAPVGQTCAQYMAKQIEMMGNGYVTPETQDLSTGCLYCPTSDSNAYLKQSKIVYSERWRNFGIMWVYVIFNIFGALFFYWLTRVPKDGKKKAKKE